MTVWRVDKIREECLKLMGHEVLDLGDPNANPRFVKAVSPMGNVRIMRFHDFQLNEAPDPTHSLDDALPLMLKYEIHLCGVLNGSGALWTAGAGMRAQQIESSAPLAVCLCALRCAGRDLKEFQL